MAYQMLHNIIFLAFIILFIFAFAFLLFWKFWFLRDPERKIAAGNNIISPADGKINSIIYLNNKKNTEIKKGIFGKFLTAANDVGKRTVIVSIVMTPMDVHFQRAPIAGKVANIKYTKGKFKNAMQGGIAIENERNEIIIKNKSVTVKVIQIAGALARRIECFAKKGEQLKKGERIGLINLGSQVSMIMPDFIEIKVREGERVIAGETIIAEMK